MKIGRRLGVSFGVILMLYLTLSAFALERIYHLAAHENVLYKHPLAVSNAVLRINSNIVKIQERVKDVPFSDDKDALALAGEIEVFEKEVYEDFDIVEELFLGDREVYLAARTGFDEWKPVRAEIFTLAAEGVRAEALELARGESADRWMKVDKALTPISAFSENKANSLHEDIIATQDNAYRLMYTLIALTIVTIIALSRTITRSITEPIKKLSKATAEIGAGDLQTRIEVDTTDEIGDLAADINAMTASLAEVTATRDEMNIEIAERKKLEEALKSANEELEDKVVERTKEVMRANEKVMRTEKLATIGQLSSSIGHELRNPLGVISNAAYLLENKLGDDADDKVKKYLDLLTKTVRKADKIVTDLLDFSRGKPPTLETVDLNRLMIEALDNVEVPEKVSVKKRLHESALDVALDSGQMLLVIENLVTNAFQAMPEGGTLLVKSGVSDDRVEFAVKDTGEGIPEDRLNRIFEPLYTTKVTGTGLGLALVDGIVARHGGTVKVNSETGVGTTFVVNLPRYREKEFYDSFR